MPRHIDTPAPLAEALEGDHDGHTIDVGVSHVVEGPLVRCRWLSPQTILTGAAGPVEEALGIAGNVVVFYGDEVWLTPAQADDPATPAERWDDNWSPDPKIAARAAQPPKD